MSYEYDNSNVESDTNLPTKQLSVIKWQKEKLEEKDVDKLKEHLMYSIRKVMTSSDSSCQDLSAIMSEQLELAMRRTHMRNSLYDN